MKTTTLIASIALMSHLAVPAFAGQPQIPGQDQLLPTPEIPPAPLPVPGEPAAASAEETNVTITVSRTIVNPPNAITIIGTASSEEEKQAIAANIQEAAPGKTVNNQLTVSDSGIFEPAGAERPDKEKSSEEKLDSSDEESRGEENSESDSDSSADDTDSR